MAADALVPDAIVAPAESAEPAGSTAAAAQARWLDRLALVVLLAEVAVVLAAVRRGFSKPFWYDEQMRAYQLAQDPTELLRQLRDAESPLALGWIAMEKAAATVFGEVEWAYRIPVVLSVPALAWATYLLGRRWLGRVGGLLVAAALLVNPILVEYAPQIKQFPFELLVTVVALLLWWTANEPGRSLRQRIGLYACLGLCTAFATATVFVIGPLLLVDLVRALREPRGVARAAPAGLAGAISAAHLLLWILPQSKVTRVGDWWDDFIPSRPLGAAIGFAGQRLAGFVPEAFTGPGHVGRPAAAVVVAATLALGGGAVVALRDRTVRPLPIALALAIAFQAVASVLDRWPFGLVRVNLFLLPLLYLLAAIGIGWPLAFLARRAAARGDQAGTSPVRRGLSAAGAAAIAVAALLILAQVVRVDAAEIGRLAGLQATTSWGDGVRLFVQHTRERARPGDVVLVTDEMGVKGWAYYMWAYDGWSPQTRQTPVIDQGHTLLIHRPTPAAVREFMARHHGAGRVFVLSMSTGKPQWSVVEPILDELGYRMVSQEKFAYTGTLRVAERRDPAPTPIG